MEIKGAVIPRAEIEKVLELVRERHRSHLRPRPHGDPSAWASTPRGSLPAWAPSLRGLRVCVGFHPSVRIAVAVASVRADPARRCSGARQTEGERRGGHHLRYLHPPPPTATQRQDRSASRSPRAFACRPLKDRGRKSSVAVELLGVQRPESSPASRGK